MGILGYIILGLIVGAIAKAIMPRLSRSHCTSEPATAIDPSRA